MSENREVEQAYGRNLFAQNDVNKSVNPCVKKEHKMTKYDVSEILCLIFLYLCSREDYRYKALTVHKIGIFGCAGGLYAGSRYDVCAEYDGRSRVGRHGNLSFQM